MKNALIIGASGGIGRALATALRDEGTLVTGLARSTHGLDLTDEASIKRCFSALDDTYDLIFVATGALEIDGGAPEKALSALTPKAMMDQFALNAAGPALVLKHAVPLLPRDRRAVFAVLSARVGSIGDNRLGGWYSYRTAKAALNQLIHGAAVELGRTHKELICACLHPGTVATAFTEKYLGRHPSVTPDHAAERLINVIKGLEPADSGGFYDYAGKEIPW
ncbi:SDR family NAD(P)-dependent oxidoreductase [Pseudoponticoccus marisrubri]|uniref:C factor, cell signaling protein n=1 Tax=Pseudoponticoccus marisrubri TaxID=1685382 RepID=A0A0W7WIX2_9RHOB|nr:SDR family NAD(P)-dependent oxidoreductase [Pseudoponticoccus marisrubri]KUF10576.1 C factor, cell signaling protein [Pseudoponticoccus marisrubri]